jgi:hypothetical protein
MPKIRPFGSSLDVASDRPSYASNASVLTTNFPLDEQMFVFGATLSGASGHRNVVTSFTQNGAGALQRCLGTTPQVLASHVFGQSMDASATAFTAGALAASTGVATGVPCGPGGFRTWPGNAVELLRTLALAATMARVSGALPEHADSNLSEQELIGLMYQRAVESIRLRTNNNFDLSGFIIGGKAGDTVTVNVTDLSGGSDQIAQITFHGISLGPGAGEAMQGGPLQHNAPYFVANNLAATDAAASAEQKQQLTLTTGLTEALDEYGVAAAFLSGGTPPALTPASLGLYQIDDHPLMSPAKRFFGQNLPPLSCWAGGSGRPPQLLAPRRFRDKDYIGYQGRKLVGTGTGTLYLTHFFSGVQHAAFAALADKYGFDG